MVTTHTLTINWPALFNSEPFRAGWSDYRAGRPIDHTLHEGADPQIRAPIDALYAIGRAAAAEAPTFDLPPPAQYFSIQMKMLLEACPEMRKEFKLSALRHFINPEQKNNVA